MTIYTGNDPLLRWYADNGADWFTEARFEDNRLEFLRWQEVVAGTPYDVLIDRVKDAGMLRVVADVQDLLGHVELHTDVQGSTGAGTVPPSNAAVHARCPLTRIAHVGTAMPGHEVIGFTQGSAFYAISACRVHGVVHSRLGVGSAFFTDPNTSGDRARALARQIINTARDIGAGKRGGRKSADLASVMGDAAPSIFTDCGKWPWRT